MDKKIEDLAQGELEHKSPELSQASQTSQTVPADQAPELSAMNTPVAKNWRSVVVWVWLGQAVSFVMSGAAGYALVWHLTITTESPLILMLGTAMFFLPMALLGPFAGTIADRYNRKTIMILSDLGIALAMFIMAFVVIAGMVSIPVVLGAIALRSIGTAFHQPAMLAVMPLLVPNRHLVRINTLDQGIQAAGNIIAPAIGIFFYVSIGLQAVLFIDVIGVLIACLILVIVTIPEYQMSKDQRSTVLGDMLDGFRAVRAVKGMTALFVLFFIGVAAFMPLASLYPLMTYDFFGGSGFDAALVEAIFGSGFLLGSIVLGIWGGGKRLMHVVVASMVLQGLTFAVIGFLTPTMFVLFVVLSGVSAIFGAFFNGPLNSIVQRCIPAEKLGRVMALMGVVTSVAAPFGLLIAGPIAEVVGMTPWFILGGVVLVAISALAVAMPSVRTLDIRGQG
ncbi:MAG: MFS transporter [Coriobacteriales bacterium]|jgi:DHA3 family macrolide efflux protein-like MFS transporter|nr:MFS transporter [Coriobacteriales bacterium]